MYNEDKFDLGIPAHRSGPALCSRALYSLGPSPPAGGSVFLPAVVTHFAALMRGNSESVALIIPEQESNVSTSISVSMR